MAKKESKNSKENYGPASILLNFSNIDEGCLFGQMSSYFESTYSKCHCRFGECMDPQYCKCM